MKDITTRSIKMKYILLVTGISLINIFYVLVLDSYSSLEEVKLQIANHREESFDVLYGLMGTDSSLFDAWEVSVKSVLLNAPTKANLHLHVLCNRDAHIAVQRKIEEAQLEGSKWQNPVKITIYNVESYHHKWQQFLDTKLRHQALDKRVTLGGYYRLLAYQILAPMGVGATLYMDPDVIVMANLNSLIPYMHTTNDKTVIFRGSSKWFCSGFIVIHMNKFQDFWEKVDLFETVHPQDQSLFEDMMKTFPETYDVLPFEWDRSLGNGHRARPFDMYEKDSHGIGMLHYQGGTGRSKKENYFTNGLEWICSRTPQCKGKEDKEKIVHRSWGLGDFYIRLDWKYAKYFGASNIAPGHEGFSLMVVVMNLAIPLDNLNSTTITSQ